MYALFIGKLDNLLHGKIEKRQLYAKHTTIIPIYTVNIGGQV
jgi:hypothetical protein